MIKIQVDFFETESRLFQETKTGPGMEGLLAKLDFFPAVQGV